MDLAFILFLFFCTAGLFGYSVIPIVYGQAAAATQQRQQKFSVNMEQIMPRQEARKWSRLFVAAPLALAGLLYFIFPPEFRLIGVGIGLLGGFALPGTFIKLYAEKRQTKFVDQMVDALMIMSSGFRGGLSLIQALEAVVEEMPDPMCKEISIVLGENKMGVSLEEALNHLYNRMPSSPLQQMITAVLLARETGGNLPVIFSRIVTNIRERKKIQQSLDTLTIQGKLQAVVMSLLPIGFAFVLYTTNRVVFENMLRSDTGKGMLIYATVSWLIGVVTIVKLSRLKDF